MKTIIFGKKLIITILGIILAILAGIAIYTQNIDTPETAELITLQVNEVTRSVFYAPQYVAIANGYMEEEGLEIEITTILWIIYY